ncbi:MAG TPA: hypothetical protein VGC76_08675 [Pyrinomonadaceae bacterium]|jgi:hypothetical protein
MIHFYYLIGFALFVSIVFGALANGTSKERLIYGLKIFAQFLAVSLVLGWILYYIPW